MDLASKTPREPTRVEKRSWFEIAAHDVPSRVNILKMRNPELSQFDHSILLSNRLKHSRSGLAFQISVIHIAYRFLPALVSVDGSASRMTDKARDSDRRALMGKAAKLTDLVRYQEGSVVSKTIVENKMGTVTLFAFDGGQGLSEHTAPFDALVSILDGEAIVTISGKSHRLNEGEAILLPANQPHALEGPGKFKMMLTMIRS
jgi:quercetin dioxygenase-like cupin family protein